MIKFSSSFFRKSWIAIPYATCLLLLVLPLLSIISISFSEFSASFPPYSSIFQWTDTETFQVRLSFANYSLVIHDSMLYGKAYSNSLFIAFLSTFFCLLLGYPMAYGITRFSPRKQLLWLMLSALPFATSFLVRVYSWMNILSPDGVGMHLLQEIGIPPSFHLMHTTVGVIIGIVYSYLPFMIFPIYASLSRIDPTLLEAAHDLGCKPFRALRTITIPLSLPGIFSGASLVFIPAMGEYIIPELLGGSSSLTIGRLLWYEFFTNRDWPVACALAVCMIVLLFIPIILFERLQPKLKDPYKDFLH